MLIVEDVVMVAMAPEGQDLIGQFRQVVVGGSVLTELMLRGHLALDDKGRIQPLDVPGPEDPLLDDGWEPRTEAQVVRTGAEVTRRAWQGTGRHAARL